MKQAFIEKNFHDSTLETIAIANGIIEEYTAQGYSLTLRQVYYQMVARGYIPNRQREYDRLGRIINDARLAGLVDWQAIEDRTRNLQEEPTWESPAEIIRSALHSYKIDLWEDQPYRVEIWVEKDALRGVTSQIAQSLSVPEFSCRGYVSQSEMYRAARRLKRWQHHGQKPVIIHLGDHDPSGIDMTRDIADRIELFTNWTRDAEFHVIRAALNYDQVLDYNPPPNPAKTTDSRSGDYIKKFGKQSWELDALTPDTIDELITEIVEQLRDDDLFTQAEEKQEHERKLLGWIQRNFSKIEGLHQEEEQTNGKA